MDNNPDTTERKIQNLRPFAPGESRTVEMARKGGSVVSKAKALAKIRHCSTRCPIYPCFSEPFSHSDGKCALKRLPSDVQNRAIDLLLKGETGFNRQMVNLLLDLSAGAKTPEEKRKLLYDIGYVKKLIYLPNRKEEPQVNENKPDMAATVERVRRAIMELEREQPHG